MFIELTIAVVVAALVSLIACRALMLGGPVDVPDGARKAHGSPTPTSGGLGIAFGFAIGLITLAFTFARSDVAISAQGVGLLSATAMYTFAFLALGFIDDASPLGPRLKFSLFAAAAIGSAWTVGVVTHLPLGGGADVPLPLLVGLIGSALWVFTLINSVNFMDGSNGLAMGSAAIGLAALGVIAVALDSENGAAVTFCAVGALLGFLVWNFPRGRLFAGDSGALFVGAVAALASLLVIQRTGLSPFVPPILFFPLLADALLTLRWRAARRRSLLDAHAEHIYQIALRAGFSHTRIALIYWAAMALCGGVGVIVALLPDSPAPWIALAVFAVVSVIISGIVRRYASKQGIAEI